MAYGHNFLSGCGFRPRGCGFLPRVRFLVTRPGRPSGCAPASSSWRCDYVPEGLGPGAACRGENLPWSWQDLSALPGSLLTPPLSVLPKRIQEEIPSPNTETQDETALGEVALDRPHTTTDFEPQTPKPEQLLRRRLLGVLIWGLVVLTVGVLTA